MADNISQPAAKRQRISFAKDVTLMIGSPPIRVTVHNFILSKTSAHFETVLQDEDWLTNKIGIIELPNAKYEMVESYLHWAYQNEIVHGYEDTEEHAADIYHHLIQLYAFAQEIQATKLKNDVMDGLSCAVDKFKKPISPADTAFAFTNISANSKLLWYITDWWIYRAYPFQVIDEQVQSWPASMQSQIIRAAMQGVSTASMSRELPREKRHMCYYHEHDATLLLCSKTPTEPGPVVKLPPTPQTSSVFVTTTKSSAPIFGGRGFGFTEPRAVLNPMATSSPS